MSKITIISLWISLCVAICYGAPQKIVGGIEAPAGSAPYMVNLRQAPPTNSFFCGGSIIGSRTVITAGHCVLSRQPWNVIVTTGSQSLTTGGTRYMATDLIVHPNYHDRLLANDLAIVIVEEDFELSSNVAIIPLATEEVVDGSSIVLTGWGRLEYDGSIPDALQILAMTIVNNEQCRVYYGASNPVYRTQACTYNGVGYGSCNGDSGGPLITEDGKLYAMVSWGYGCASGAPDVNTLIPSFREWIVENTI